MHVRIGFAAALALLATLGASSLALASSPRSTEVEGLSALEGEWLYVEDRTEGREPENQQPSMSTSFALRTEEGAVVLVRGKGAKSRELRIALDGSTTEVAGSGTTTQYRGGWKEGALAYETKIVSAESGARVGYFKTEMRPTADGLLVRVVVDSTPPLDTIAFYRHPQDIPLPAPAQAKVDELTWLAGAWVGTMGKSRIEERWSPPLGGAMLGLSRTVKGEAMVAFEYLRVVQRDGGLVYVAQPNGSPPTEFVLTELSGSRAVFENPRHDSPQRIAYELSSEGTLSASIGFIKGGRPQRFEFKRESG
jgi:hypothetical protein